MQTTAELTGRQREIWSFIVDYVDRHGYPPTVREIGGAVGLASPSTVHAHLANLERAGLLRRDPTKPRALELVGRLVVAGKGDHDLAVPRVLSPPHDDDVAVENPRFDHRVALDPQEEVAAEILGHRDLVLDVLLRQQRPAGSDLPQQRQLR